MLKVIAQNPPENTRMSTKNSFVPLSIRIRIMIFNSEKKYIFQFSLPQKHKLKCLEMMKLKICYSILLMRVHPVQDLMNLAQRDCVTSQ